MSSPSASIEMVSCLALTVNWLSGEVCSPSVTVKLNPPDSEPEIRHKQSYSLHHVTVTIKVL